VDWFPKRGHHGFSPGQEPILARILGIARQCLPSWGRGEWDGILAEEGQGWDDVWLGEPRVESYLPAHFGNSEVNLRRLS